MKRKTAILVVSYFCAAIFMLGIFSSLQASAVSNAERNERYGEEHAFEELCAAMGALDLSLQKCALATTPGLAAALSADVYAQSMAAVAALGALPDSHELEHTAEFLGRTGDFARCLARCAASGVSWSEKDRRNLDRLAEISGWTAQQLTSLRGSIADGLSVSSDTYDALRALESNYPTVPEIVCDGRYSPRNEVAAMLQGKALCSEREASLIAAAFLEQRSSAAAVEGKSGTEFPCWRVVLGDYTLAVSEQGGQVVQVVCGRAVGEEKLSVEEARKAADKFLRDRGYSSMVETGFTLENGSLVTSWCYEQSGVLCYPDELRIAIALDTGELMGFDATNYIQSHRQRNLDAGEISWENARNTLLPGLTVEQEYLSVFSGDGGGEKLCFTFVCRDENDARWIVFSSTATGAQEHIARLQEDEQGLRTL